MGDIHNLHRDNMKFPPDTMVWCEDEWENLLVMDAEQDKRLLANGKWYHVSELEEGMCRLTEEQRRELNINLPDEE